MSGSIYFDRRLQRFCIDNAEQTQLSSGMSLEVLAIDGQTLEWTPASVEYDRTRQEYCFKTGRNQYRIEEGMTVRI